MYPRALRPRTNPLPLEILLAIPYYCTNGSGYIHALTGDANCLRCYNARTDDEKATWGFVTKHTLVIGIATFRIECAACSARLTVTRAGDDCDHCAATFVAYFPRLTPQDLTTVLDPDGDVIEILIETGCECPPPLSYN